MQAFWHLLSAINALFWGCFCFAVLSGVLQVVKGPYWGNFIALFH